MKFTISTVKLQDMVTRAARGAKMDKTSAITCIMAISLKDNVLTLITTDESNTLYIKEPVKGEDFYCVVDVDKFNKLVSKLTSENTTLELEDFILIIKANGTYKIELEPDADGDMTQFPDPMSEVAELENAQEISMATIKKVLATNKSALATTMEIPCYTGYYIGNKVVSSDTDVACSLNSQLVKEPILVASETMNLLTCMQEDKVKAYIKGEVIIFETDTCVIYGYLMEDIDEYAIDTISALLDESFESSCKLSKIDMLALLDRIGLFVGLYDNGAITLTFTDKGIDISSKQSSGIETINYIASENYKPYTCLLNIQQLAQLVKALESDTFIMQYGNDKSIKIVDGDITQVIALLV